MYSYLALSWILADAFLLDTSRWQPKNILCSEKDSKMEPTMKLVADKNSCASCGLIKEVHHGMWTGISPKTHAYKNHNNQPKRQSKQLFKEGVKIQYKASKNYI